LIIKKIHSTNCQYQLNNIEDSLRQSQIFRGLIFDRLKGSNLQLASIED